MGITGSDSSSLLFSAPLKHRLWMSLGNGLLGLSFINLYLHLRGGDAAIVRKDTEIVIEGPPRCGNTTAVAAFRLAQKRPINIAHHIHGPAQVVLAARWGIPCLVLLRDPLRAAISLHLRDGRLGVAYALDSIVNFMDRIQPYCDSFIAVQMEDLLESFDEVVSTINRRYGTSFKLLGESVATSQDVLSEVEAMDARDQGGAPNEQTVSRPSAVRRVKADGLYEQCRQNESIQKQYRHAIDLMSRLLEGNAI